MPRILPSKATGAGFEKPVERFHPTNRTDPRELRGDFRIPRHFCPRRCRAKAEVDDWTLPLRRLAEEEHFETGEDLAGPLPSRMSFYEGVETGDDLARWFPKLLLASQTTLVPIITLARLGHPGPSIHSLPSGSSDGRQ